MIATVLMSLALQATTPAATQATRYTGIARAKADGPVLYREEHIHYGPPDARRELVLYRCPDGQAFARKKVRQAGSVDPDFSLSDAANGYHEGVRTVDGKRQVYVRHVGKTQTQSAPLPAAKRPVIDSGFDAFVRRHWDALAAGRKQTLQFLVPSKLEFMNFRIVRHHDAKAAAKGVLVLRLELDHWFAFVLPHIDVGYQRSTHQLLWFRGLSNLRDRHGNNLKVVVRFPPDKRGIPLSAAQLKAAQSTPLNGRCRLD